MSFKEQGDFYFRNDRFEEALGFYQKALLLDKENPFLQYRVAECRISIDEKDTDFTVEAQHAKHLLQRNLKESNDLLDESDDLLGTEKTVKKHRSYLDISNNIEQDEVKSNIDVEALKQVRKNEIEENLPIWQSESLRPFILTAASLGVILMILTLIYLVSGTQTSAGVDAIMASNETSNIKSEQPSVAIDHLIAQAEEFEEDGNFADALLYYGRVINYQPENQRILDKISKVKDALANAAYAEQWTQFEGKPQTIEDPSWEIDAAYEERIRFDRWRMQQEYLLDNYELPNANNSNVSVKQNQSSLQIKPINEVFDNLESYSEARTLMYYDTLPSDVLAQESKSSITPSILPSQQIVFDPEVEAQPRFGQKDLKSVLEENLLYPFEARKKGIEGLVLLQFTVETNGALSNIRALSQVGGGCEIEAQRLLKLTKWVPAKNQGQRVRSLKELSINFSLK